MTNWRDRFARWRDDPLLRRVIRSSAYLSSSNTLAAGLGFLQNILIARLLGANALGEVVTVIAFATAINNLLSFRMSEVLVRHFNVAIAEGKKDEAAAIARGTGTVEAGTSIIAYAILLLLAPWAGRTFFYNHTAASFIAYYGVILLSNIVFETSRGVLQAHRRFRQIAILNLIQSVLTFSIILGAYLLGEYGVQLVLTAYIAGKTLSGVVIVILAILTLNEFLPGWWRVPLRTFTGWRGLFSFALNTNLNGSVNQFLRENIPLYIAMLTSSADVGYYKIAFSFTNLLMLPIEPFIWPTYTEITRTIAEKSFAVTRSLLRRVSAISAVWIVAVSGTIALLGWWFIPLLYGPEYSPAYPAVLILLIGYGFTNIFGWNRPLLLALGKPTFPLIVAALAGLIEIALIFWLVPLYGYLAAAAILSGYLILTVTVLVWRGVFEMRRQQLAAS